MLLVQSGIALTSRMLVLALGLFANSACSRNEPLDRNSGMAQTAVRDKAVIDSAKTVSEALKSQDTDSVVRLLARLNCPMSDTATVTELQQVWLDTHQTPTGVGSELMRTLLAKCMIEASQTKDIPDTIRNSAAAQLRGSLDSSQIRVAATALSGLTHVATSDDVGKILMVALTRPELATASAAALSLICRPEAKLAIAKIVTAYAGTTQGTSIDDVVAQQKADAGACTNKHA